MDQTPYNAPSDLRPYLQLMVRMRASDLFLTVQAPPTLKVEGTMRRLDTKPLDSNEVRALAYSVLRESQRKAFETDMECDLAIAVEGLGRFRVNVYMQRGDIAMVARHISSTIPTMESLRLPPILKDLAMLKRGLVLVVGAAGSGKSTTLASMLDYRNANSACHILTVEDPIEFTHVHKMSLVDQREVGLDTRSFGDALRHAMREAPDVIMIGEIRDRETIQHALSYAETGHLCVSTLHSNNANQAIDRILNLFPDEARKQALLDLSLNLKGVVGQRLVRGRNGKRVPAVEVMLQSAYISELILKGQIDQIKAAMVKEAEDGMQTFDQALYDLYAAGDITADEALAHADSRTDLGLRIKLHPAGGGE